MADDNPFDAPVTDSVRPDPGARLYSPGQVLLATFIGSVVCGFYLMRCNYAAAGQARRGDIMLAVAVAAFATLVAATWQIEGTADRLINLVTTIVGMIIVHNIYRRDLREAYDQRTAGDPAGRRPHGHVALVLLTYVAVFVVIAFAVGFAEALNEPPPSADD
jgi:hypothetical protein